MDAAGFSQLRWRPVLLIVSVCGLLGCSQNNSDKPAQHKTEEGIPKEGQCLRGQQLAHPDLDENWPLSLRHPQEVSLADQDGAQNLNFVTPTVKVEEAQWPHLEDDLLFAGIEEAIDRQIRRFRQMNLRGTIQLGADIYPLSRALSSLEVFKKIVAEYTSCLSQQQVGCADNLNANVQKNFYMYRPLLAEGDPRFGEDDPVLFTAYYTPRLQGSLQPTAKYRYPVYQMPREERKRAYPRLDIDFSGALVGQGLELFYTDNLFDLYLLHVQGGGHVTIANGGKRSSRYLSYSGTNGQKWNFISKYMMEKGYINDGSIAAQRTFLTTNPHREQEVYATCPSYVYFQNSDHPPLGSDMVPLTDNRSIATDTRFYKFKGLLSFVQAARPTEQSVQEGCDQLEFKTYSRFYLDQDTGGAIRGKGRVDLYFGEGTYAELAAYNLVRRGDLFFLILKR